MKRSCTWEVLNLCLPVKAVAVASYRLPPVAMLIGWGEGRALGLMAQAAVAWYCGKALILRLRLRFVSRLTGCRLQVDKPL